MENSCNTIDLKHVSMQDLPQVGGKNASLGEMISHLTEVGLLVPAGFATTADAFREFLSNEGLDKSIYALLEGLDIENVEHLTVVGKKIREMVLNTPFPAAFERDVRASFKALEASIGHEHFSVAVRSSATAEDLPDASFAGQQETYLNVQGIDAVLLAIKRVFASLFNDRAITYRAHMTWRYQLEFNKWFAVIWQ